MNGFGMPVAIAATIAGEHLRRPNGEPLRWPVTERRAALLWLGNQPRKAQVVLRYVPALTKRERELDQYNRPEWGQSPESAYGGLRLVDMP